MPEFWDKMAALPIWRRLSLTLKVVTRSSSTSASAISATFSTSTPWSSALKMVNNFNNYLQLPFLPQYIFLIGGGAREAHVGLRLIGRYLRRKTTVKYRKTSDHLHISMIKGFYILNLSQHILKTHEKRINVSVLVLYTP